MTVSRVILNYLLKAFFFIGRLLSEPIFQILQLGKREKLPPIKNDLLLVSAKELARMIRTQKIKSETVIQAYIDRVNEVNEILNAIVEERFELALEESRAVDAFIASNTKTVRQLEIDTPLLGVPFTVKESIAVKGLVYNGGVVRDVIRRASKDAEVVRLVRAAGAIPLLVSNAPEYNINYETVNNVTGRTKNPYDTRRTPGGSSGGEAALIASAASVVGIGSDVAGSLRLPCLFTGIFGHKPTACVASIEGNVPHVADSRYELYFTNGPVTRYAEDLPLMLDIMLKPIARQKLKLDQPVDIKTIKFFYMENETGSKSGVDRNINKAMDNLVQHLRKKHGIQVQKVNIKLLKYALFISGFTMILINGVDTIFLDKKTGKFHFWRHFFRFLTCRSKTILSIFIYGFMKRHMWLLRQSSQSFKDKEILKEEFQELLGDNGVFLYPTFPYLANFHNQIYARGNFISYMTIFNSLGLPATHCPMGLTADGLPVGIQVIAGMNNDRLNFAVAKEIEEAFGGWTPPTYTT